MDKNYLPSKMFLVRVAFILGIIAIIFGIFKTYTYFKNKPQKNNQATVLVRDVVGTDSNNNGIADWEEYLWGLNPAKNGESNKEFIMAKRKTLSENGSVFSAQNENAKESENLSKEFFAVVMSLIQSNNMSEETVAQISDVIGQKVKTEPIPDIYTMDMLTVSTTTDSEITYFQAFDKLNAKYSNLDMGGELTIIAQGIANNDPQAIKIATNMASSYRSFGQELLKIPVPEKISAGHLALVNDYEKVAKSIEGFSGLLDNPLVGMKALLNYKKYSDSIITDINNISSNLE